MRLSALIMKVAAWLIVSRKPSGDLTPTKPTLSSSSRSSGRDSSITPHDAAPFVQDLQRPPFFKRVFRRPSKREALVELSNALARAGDVREVTETDVAKRSRSTPKLLSKISHRRLLSRGNVPDPATINKTGYGEELR
jgi:hypothetical protein